MTAATLCTEREKEREREREREYLKKIAKFISPNNLAIKSCSIETCVSYDIISIFGFLHVPLTERPFRLPLTSIVCVR